MSLLFVDFNAGQHRLDDNEFPLQISFRAATLAPLRFLLCYQTNTSYHSDSGCSTSAGESEPARRNPVARQDVSFGAAVPCYEEHGRTGPAQTMSQESGLNGSSSPTVPYFSNQNSLSQTSINIESDSSSLDQQQSIESPVRPPSPGHHQVTPRRLIRTLKRMRRSSSGNRRSWHEDERRRSSTANSLRIYAGPALQEQSGSDYKTVFASDDTTTREVIEAALQRLFIYDAACEDYVLCEVMGSVEPYHCVSGEVIGFSTADEVDWSNVAHRFTPLYSRLIATNEHPQILMRLWHSDGSSERRLYLHPRQAVPQYRLGPGSPCSSPHLSVITDESAPTPQLTFVQRYCDTPSKLLFTGVHADQLRTPFLVTLSCSAPEKNLLVYPLVDKVTSIGHVTAASSLSISLGGSDLLSLHCTIRCTEFRRSITSINKSHERREVFSLDPSPGAAVAVNGVPKTSLVPLHDGDLIHLASSHVFLFRDPAEPVALSKGWKWLPQPKYGTSQEKMVSVDSSTSSQYRSTTDRMTSSRQTSAESNGSDAASPAIVVSPDQPSPEKTSQPTSSSQSLGKTMHVAFTSVEQEDNFVQLVITTHRISSLAAPLSPAAAISLAMLQFNIDGSQSGSSRSTAASKAGLKRFMNKVCEALQGVVWVSVFVL